MGIVCDGDRIQGCKDAGLGLRQLDISALAEVGLFQLPISQPYLCQFRWSAELARLER
jgi:hypothetical protein